MRRIAALVISALIMFAGAANAEVPTKADMFAKAAEGASICAQNMPDAKATSAALKNAGFKLFDANGKLKGYFAKSNRVVVAISDNSNRSDACFVMFSKMGADDAAQLIQPWLTLSKAKPAQSGGKYVKRWTGRFKGGDIGLGILKDFRTDEIRGYAIVARSLP